MWETKRQLRQEIETLNQKLNSKEHSLNWWVDQHAKLERSYNKLEKDNNKLQNLLNVKEHAVSRAIRQMNETIDRADKQTERFVNIRRQLLDELKQARTERDHYQKQAKWYERKYGVLIDLIDVTQIDSRF